MFNTWKNIAELIAFKKFFKGSVLLGYNSFIYTNVQLVSKMKRNNTNFTENYHKVKYSKI